MNFTRNYNLFKTPHNRAVNTKHIKKLVEANKKNFLLDCYPIIVNSNFELFDGQHRLEAAKLLGSPVYYIVKDDLIINHDSLLEINSHTRCHSLSDKIEIALAYKDIEVLKVKRFWELEPRIPITIVCELLGSWGNSSRTKNELSDRTYRVKHERRYTEYLSFLQKLNYPEAYKFKGTFVHATAQFWLNFPTLRQNMLDQINLVEHKTTRSAYREAFLKVVK